VTRTYRCRACGATWVSYPAGEEIERAGRCLRCDGEMVLVGSAEDDPPPPEPPRDFEAEAEETDERR
jgi:hypothetical protein